MIYSEAVTCSQAQQTASSADDEFWAFSLLGHRISYLVMEHAAMLSIGEDQMQ
jgi:hypothetical protein